MNNIRDKKGRFIKGEHYSPETEFKKGKELRIPKPYWNKDWLYNEYVVLEKSSYQIADEQGCLDTNIQYFLKKFGIKTRTTSEIRKKVYWGLSGSSNGMHGRIGETNPNWKGGISPERQTFYESDEWKKSCVAVWKRDNSSCRRCGMWNDTTNPLHVHHIISFRYKEYRTNINNLILLCKKCHNWVHSRKNINHEYIQ